jgi:hypothetical protein
MPPDKYVTQKYGTTWGNVEEEEEVWEDRARREADMRKQVDAAHWTFE